MQRTTQCLLLGVTALAVVGCGSSSSTKSSSAASTPAGTPSSSATSSENVKARTYNVKLTGASEVPKGASGASGHAVISIRAKTSELCWKFSSLKGAPSPMAAHIHKGGAGTAGPIVIPLGGAYTASGCSPASASLLSQIGAGPKGFYVNVHNAKYPGGVVRAQL